MPRRKIRFELPKMNEPPEQGEHDGSASLERGIAKLYDLRDEIDNGENDDCMVGQMRIAAEQEMMIHPAQVTKVLQQIRDGVTDALSDIVKGRAKGRQ